MNNDLIIIRVNKILKPEDLQRFRESVVHQRIQAGNVIVLPYGCDVITAPEDVEIQIRDINESRKR